MDFGLLRLVRSGVGTSASAATGAFRVLTGRRCATPVNVASIYMFLAYADDGVAASTCLVQRSLQALQCRLISAALWEVRNRPLYLLKRSLGDVLWHAICLPPSISLPRL